jgi:hypothetical protein
MSRIALPPSQAFKPRQLLIRAAAMTAVSALLLAFVGLWRHDEAVLAAGANPPTPGNFTGYGFDQCQTPSQQAMDAWLEKSPFLAVGVYISGDNRGCLSQPNLTPTWVSTQLANGWKILPITVGPQAKCYGGSKPLRIPSAKASNYKAARDQAAGVARQAVADAQALGIVPGSTIYYDLEAFQTSPQKCAGAKVAVEATLRFLGAWTNNLHLAGYKSGVYGSVGSSLKILDNVRINRPKLITLPDQIWLARYDGLADLSSPDYLSEEGWQPRSRIKQYMGGCLTYAASGACTKYNSPTYGGVTINIDLDYMSLGKGSVAPKVTHCNAVPVDFDDYVPLAKPVKGNPRTAAEKAETKALKCLLAERGTVAVSSKNAAWGKGLVAAINNWQVTHGFAPDPAWSRADWVSLLAAGDTQPIYKYGSASDRVRDLQRALNAAIPGRSIPITGAFFDQTSAALKKYQALVGLPKDGITDADTWAALEAGQLTKPVPPPLCPTDSPSPTVTLSVSLSPTASMSPSATPTDCASPTVSASPTASATPTLPARK